ncbi:synapse assembly [Mactra antiquata]
MKVKNYKPRAMRTERIFQCKLGILLVFLLICISVSNGNAITTIKNLTDNAKEISEFPIYDESFHFAEDEPKPQFHINSSECQSINSCSRNETLYPGDKTCACDDLCGILNDCCPDIEIVPSIQLSNDQLICEYVKGIGPIMLVTKCPVNWTEDETRTLCENRTKNKDMISKVVVSDKSIEGLVFKNMHCAMCNNVYDYQFWNAVINCPEFFTNDNTTVAEEDLSFCDFSLDQPSEVNTARDCSLTSAAIISECDEVTDTDIVEKCEGGGTLLTYDGYQTFKNKYCAICNGHHVSDLTCQQSKFPFLSVIDRINDYYSFRILVDFNSKNSVKEHLMGVDFDKEQSAFLKCNDDQIFDPFSRHCRNIICPAKTRAFEGRCIPLTPPDDLIKQNSSNTSNSTSTDHCALSKVMSHEVEYFNKTNQVLFRKKLYNETEYIRNGSDIFLCINTSVPSHYGRSLQASDELEGYLSLIGLIISIISLSITIIIYIIFSELLNIPGKNLVSLCISLLLAQLLFLLSPKVSHYVIACQIFAVLMHYFFLAAFSWMNVIAFDLLMTFSNTFGVGHRTRSSKKKFITYSIYSWCVPLIVVLSAVIVDYSIESDIIKEFKPLYGQVGCWISSKYALLLFFVGPLVLLKLFDFIAFGVIVYHITKAKKQGAMARNENNSCTFFIHVKLSLVMGLTWVFAFIANFGGSAILWYLFIIFNTLQGLFIAVSFVCTRRVLRLIKSKYNFTTSKTSLRSSSTQGTSLSSKSREKS